MRGFNVNKLVRDERMMSEQGRDEGVKHVDNRERLGGQREQQV